MQGRASLGALKCPAWAQARGPAGLCWRQGKLCTHQYGQSFLAASPLPNRGQVNGAAIRRYWAVAPSETRRAPDAGGQGGAERSGGPGTGANGVRGTARCRTCNTSEVFCWREGRESPMRTCSSSRKIIVTGSGRAPAMNRRPWGHGYPMARALWRAACHSGVVISAPTKCFNPSTAKVDGYPLVRITSSVSALKCCDQLRRVMIRWLSKLVV